MRFSQSLGAKEEVVVVLNSLTMEGSTLATTNPNSSPSNLGSRATMVCGRSDQLRPLS